MTDDQDRAPSWRAANTEVAEQAADAASEARFFRIDEVSRRTGLTKRTLRYYEELGLLEPAQRSEGNYRLYSVEDIHAFERIVAMRDLLGLELKEIKEMIAAEMERDRIRARWQSDTDPTSRLHALDEVEQVVHRELTLLEEKLAGLEQMRQALLERLEKYQSLRAEIHTRIDRTTDLSH